MLGHKHAVNRKPASDALRAHAFVSLRRECLGRNVDIALALALAQERLDGVGQLAFLRCPADRLPLLHQVKERVDADVGRGLTPLEIKKVELATDVEPDHHVHAVVAAACADRVIGGPVDVHLLARRQRRVPVKPLGPEVVTLFRRGALLEERRPARRQLPLTLLTEEVAIRVLWIQVPQKLGLQRPGVVAVVGQLVATGVPQHVHVTLNTEIRRCSSPLDHP